jgi:hypothetical protein
MNKRCLIITLVTLTLLALAGCQSPSPSPTVTSAPPPSATPVPEPSSTPLEPTAPPVEPTMPPLEPTAPPVEPSATSVEPTVTPVEPTATPGDPYALISLESLLAFTTDLTAIQPYSGWRNSATEGEAEALDYVTARLNELDYLHSLGLELERQSFRVFMSTEQWESGLRLTVGGQEFDIPAAGLRGPRDDVSQALRFDSDGALNDAQRDPVVVQGPVLLLRSEQEINALDYSDVQDKVVFMDYAVINKALLGTQEAEGIAWNLLDKAPAGLVLVTQFSTAQGGSHGYGVGDVSALNWVETDAAPPTLYVRLEDLAPAGINTWGDLAQIESARLTWDADVFQPGASGNLAARIPGADSSQAVILGAHIDSPNGPGAMDDGSGSVILLEIARVLDAARVQPAVDLYLVWFGSEEIGLYGGAHFAATHQELLDQTLAMLQIDDLTRPLDGIEAALELVTWSYYFQGDDSTPWPSFLAQASAQQGLETVPQDFRVIYSDNSMFAGFDVPQADLIYESEAMNGPGGFHYAASIHSPYDTVELAREMGDVLEQMAQVALVAALETGRELPDLRPAPAPRQRALFVGSHTESTHMAPSALVDLGMTLSWEGLDVDWLPYGQAVTPADLQDAALVVVLPVYDYPPDDAPYDEAWSQAEIAALEAYVAQGGLLALTNSAHRLKYNNSTQDANEDWSDVNALAERFGVTFHEGTLSANYALPEIAHPLVQGITYLELAQDNAVPFSFEQGQTLAWADGEPAIALLDYGDAGGQVLVLADVGLLGAGTERFASGWGGAPNTPLWQNLARWVGD